MQNAHLKKRVMAALISGVLATGTTAVIATNASADQLVVDAYQKLDEAQLQELIAEQKKLAQIHTGYDNSTQTLPTEYGPGWCIDWGIDNPWNNKVGGYDVRKLTGTSGRVGDGMAIDENVRIAAINLTKSMLADYDKYMNGDASVLPMLEKKNTFLQALLANNLGVLNDVRGNIQQQDSTLFYSLTGFSIVHQTLPAGNPNHEANYVLNPDESKLAKIKQTVKPGEFVTVLVPKNYNLNLNPKQSKTFQRIITVHQPGLDIYPDKPDYNFETEVEETTTPRSTVTTTVNEPDHEATTTVPAGNPYTTTVTETAPATVTTERRSREPITSTVTTTRPERVTTVTNTKPVETEVVTTTENGTPVTKTVKKTPEPEIVTETIPSTVATETQTITEETVTKTVPAQPVTKTSVVTPVSTVKTTVPGRTGEVVTTVTGEPTTVTKTISQNDHYYTEKVYEKVREVYEYYQFAGFTKEEQSKVIDLDKRIKDSWTFEVTEGSEYVIVERNEDGKLVVTPRPGFKGEGKVTIVVTDSDGNEHVYRLTINNTVNVDESTHVKVNNFFYNINTGGNGDRFKLINIDEGETHKTVKGGDIAVVKDDGQGHLKVTPKDGVTKGEVIVEITDKQGNTRENVITIENKESQYNVSREILNTSVGFVEHRGGKAEITEGKDVITVEEAEVNGDKVWKIVPKDGVTEGEAHVVFTDEEGIEYNFDFKVVPDPNGGPKVIEHDINFDGNVDVQRKDGYEAKVVEGQDLVDLTETDKTWTVTPKQDNDDLRTKGGKAVVHVKDANGQLVGVVTINIKPQSFEVPTEPATREREIVDRATANFHLGAQDSGHWFKVEALDGSSLSDLLQNSEDYDGKKLEEDLELHFKPGADGKFKVTEFLDYGEDQVDENAIPLVEYTYTVKPYQPREAEYTITSENEIDLQGTKLSVVEGEDLLESVPTAGESKIKITPKGDANGDVVIENKTDDGYVFERYTLHITPGRGANKGEVTEKNMTWTGTARISKDEGDTYKIVSAKDAEGNDVDGNDLVRVKEENGQFVVTGRAGKTGVVTITVSDKRGVYATYKLNIGEAEGARVYNYQISTNSEFRATLVEKSNKFVVIDGEDYFENPTNDGNQWIAKPKASAAGKTATIEEWDADGNVINTYNLKIVEGKSTGSREVRDYIVMGSTKTDKPMTKGNSFKVVSGTEFVDAKSNNDGTFSVTPKSGTEGKTVVTEEYDKDGNVVRKISSLIVPSGSKVENGAILGENKDLGVKIDRDEKTGKVTIKFEKEDGSIAVLEGAELVDQETDKDGNVVLTPKNPNGNNKVIFIPLAGGVQGKKPMEVDVQVNVDADAGANGGNGKGDVNVGSSDPKCIASLVGLASPLLLLIPLGVLSQVNIPGLEGLRGQLNAAIQDANDRIQQGLGIYDRDRASRAAGVQGAFSVENSQMIGVAAGALGVITAGLLIGDAVLRACGQEESTSSYQLGEATDNDTLRYGSSGKPAEAPKSEESEAAKSEESEAPKSEEAAAAEK
ncbi:hypothetical protein MHK13_06165 [Corynebacterium hadale]|nr:MULTISPECIES: hypothetical protein [Corynebacterium]MCG7254311.1 hypothetical protein [Corynebacterium hadale]MCG7257536.1 hypothetical protein [Corynebacterium hadale]MCG7266038.1 hypothetical protein [Corynebacterium hadale]